MTRKSKIILLTTLLVQGVFFLGVLFSVQKNELQIENLSGDAVSYTRVAKNVLCCSTFSFSEKPPLVPDSVRTPGYPLFLAFLYGITKSWLAVLVFQILLLSSVPLLLYLALRPIDESIAWVSAFVFLFEPSRLFWSGMIMTDAIFTMGLLLSVLAFVRWFRSSKDVFLVLSGALLGVSTLIRPISLYLWIAFCVAIIVRFGVKEWRGLLKRCILFLCSFFIFIAPWMVRNYSIYGSWQLSPIGSYSFAYANATQFLHYKTGRPLSEIYDEFNAPLLSQSMEDGVSLYNVGWYKEFSKQAIGSDYFGYIRFHIVKTIPYFITDGFREIPEYLGYMKGVNRPNLSNYFLHGELMNGLYEYIRAQPFSSLFLFLGVSFWILVWVGAIFALPTIIKDKKNRVLWVLFILIIGYFVAASSGPVAQPRYRLPITGFLLFISLLGWRFILSRIRKNKIQAIFLDRDGVITPKLGKGEYVLHENDVCLEQGVSSALQMIPSSIPLFIVSNQSCVHRGLMTLERAHTIQKCVLQLLEQEGIQIRGNRICPHVGSDGCACRKPKPGMILELCREHGINPKRAIMIGDSVTDLEAGNAAGCRSYLIDQETHLHDVLVNLIKNQKKTL